MHEYQFDPTKKDTALNEQMSHFKPVAQDLIEYYQNNYDQLYLFIQEIKQKIQNNTTFINMLNLLEEQQRLLDEQKLRINDLNNKLSVEKHAALSYLYCKTQGYINDVLSTINLAVIQNQLKPHMINPPSLSQIKLALLNLTKAIDQAQITAKVCQDAYNNAYVAMREAGITSNKNYLLRYEPLFCKWVCLLHKKQLLNQRTYTTSYNAYQLPSIWCELLNSMPRTPTDEELNQIIYDAKKVKKLQIAFSLNFESNPERMTYLFKNVSKLYDAIESKLPGTAVNPDIASLQTIGNELWEEHVAHTEMKKWKDNVINAIDTLLEKLDQRTGIIWKLFSFSTTKEKLLKRMKELLQDDGNLDWARSNKDKILTMLYDICAINRGLGFYPATSLKDFSDVIKKFKIDFNKVANNQLTLDETHQLLQGRKEETFACIEKHFKP